MAGSFRDRLRETERWIRDRQADVSQNFEDLGREAYNAGTRLFTVLAFRWGSAKSRGLGVGSIWRNTVFRGAFGTEVPRH